MSTETTEAVLKHHLDAFGAGDVDAILSDYADDAILITPNGMLEGPDEIRPVFDAMTAEFAKPGMTMNMQTMVVNGDLAYIVWNAETADNVYELATDTLIVHDGKIVQQTFAGKVTPKN